jgi:cytochrome c peroxidase
MKKLLVIACVAALAAALNACRKDPETTTAVYAPVPYKLQVPDFVKNYVGEMPQPPDNLLTEEGVALGRKLFYEKMLSDDGSMSCGSCHKQANGFDDPRPFSQGTNSAFGNRNAMAIINMGWEHHFFWDTRRSSLEGQAHDPVTNPIEMANNWPEVDRRMQNSAVYPDLFFKAFGTTTIDSDLVVKAIAQFERTLVSFNSRFDKYQYLGDSTALNAQEKAGYLLFKAKECKNCHLLNTLFTDGHPANNGLDVNPVDPGLMKFTNDPADRGKFKVPTLRNIELTAPYMHDSRFNTLEEVVNYYSSNVHQNSPNIDMHMQSFGSGLNLTNKEKADLVAFLKTLTDNDFATNPAFSEPK